MTAYYNEYDPFAAAWLRNLIADGLIAPGEVDERSITEVQPEDLEGFTQVHLFAGVGVWSHALRCAGWRDYEPVWTGSCPCPPFSAAGIKGCPLCKKNIGTATRLQFLGDGHSFGCPTCSYRDPRHLWPEMWRLVEKRRPGALFGEQVASADGRTWIDIVQSDLETADYAFTPINLCAAGFGAPHIRQRFFFVADAASSRCSRDTIIGSKRKSDSPRPRWRESERSLPHRTMGDAESGGRGERRREEESRSERHADFTEPTHGMGESSEPGLEGHSGNGEGRDQPGRIEEGQDRPTAAPGATNGFWNGALWLYCKDEKYRPTQPGIFPLVDGPSRNRVGLLRGAGNAIVAPVAQAFIEAYLEVKHDR